MNDIDKIIERYIEEERDIGRTGSLRVFLGENEGEKKEDTPFDAAKIEEEFERVREREAFSRS